MVVGGQGVFLKFVFGFCKINKSSLKWISVVSGYLKVCNNFYLVQIEIVSAAVYILQHCFTEDTQTSLCTFCILAVTVAVCY